MIRRPPRSTLFPYTRSSDLALNFGSYRLIPMGSGGSPEGERYEFFGHGMVEELVARSEEHTSELQSHLNLVCRLLLEKKNTPTQLHLRYLLQFYPLHHQSLH